MLYVRLNLICRERLVKMKIAVYFLQFLFIFTVHSYIIYQKIPSNKRSFFFNIVNGFKPKLSKNAVLLTNGKNLNKLLTKQRQNKSETQVKQSKRYYQSGYRRYRYSRYRRMYSRYRRKRFRYSRYRKNKYRTKYRRRSYTIRRLYRKRKYSPRIRTYYRYRYSVKRPKDNRNYRSSKRWTLSRKPRMRGTTIAEKLENRKSDQVGLSEQDKYLLVKAHNRIRRNVEPSSANMRKIEWDDKLAQIAQKYAEKCIGKHNVNRTSEQSKFTNVGENIYYSWNWHINMVTGERIIAPLDVEKAVTQWDNEKLDYDFYNPRRCICGCGHYKQAVRDAAYAMGCGTAFCPKVEYKYFSRAHILVCNYGEGYNLRETPYKSGPPCSECDSQFPLCIKGLCSRVCIGA